MNGLRNTKATSASRRREANFDRVARVYRWAEYALLGRLLTRAREWFLPEIQHARHALVLGDGDGRFLAALLRRAPPMHALAVDTSARMLQFLKERCRFAAARLSTLQVSAVALPADLASGGVDLIVTHFFLDCLAQPDVDQLAKTLASSVKPGCLWVLSEFGLPSRQPWRLLAHLYVRGLYFAFRLLTGLRPQQLPDIHRALLAAGFCRVHHHAWLKGLLYGELWQLGPRRLSAKPGSGATSACPESSTLT